MLQTLTDLGDAMLILPASLILFVYLWVAGSRRTALGWALSISLCITLVTLSKIGFHACRGWVVASTIHSPSGHAAFAATFYGCGARLLASGQPRRTRTTLALLAIALIVSIAISRVALDFHNPAEVGVGLMIGAVCVGLFCTVSADAGAVRTPSRAALALFVFLAVLSHGRHVDAERWIAGLSDELRGTADICTAARIELNTHG